MSIYLHYNFYIFFIYLIRFSKCRYTVRSVMGDYGGYAALFEIFPIPLEDGNTAYEYYYSTCPFVNLSVVTITAVLTLIWCLLIAVCCCFKIVKSYKVKTS